MDNLMPDAQETFSNIHEMVSEFQTAMGQKPDLELAKSLIIEEAEEVIEATNAFNESGEPEDAAAYLKEVADLIYVLSGAYAMCEELGVRNAIDFDEEAKTILENAMSSMAEAFHFGIITDYLVYEAIVRVHASNMSKMGEDGKPIYGDEGKVLKGPNYQPADLSDLGEQTAHNLAVVNLMSMMGVFDEEDEDEEEAA